MSYILFIVALLIIICISSYYTWNIYKVNKFEIIDNILIVKGLFGFKISLSEIENAKIEKTLKGFFIVISLKNGTKRGFIIPNASNSYEVCTRFKQEMEANQIPVHLY
jgi:hypothetical protein